MKKYFLIFLLVLFASCEEDKKSTKDYSENDQPTESLPPGNIQKERDAVQTEKEEPKTVATLNGKYRKMVKDQPATDCNCNCIDISFDGPTEWCIVKDKVYISARCQKTGENTADLYLVGPSRDIDPERKMPWNEFDTDMPIASIEFQPDGSAKLDWKGFSTNGKIATDYAIYGKKTLEGTYKKE
ncbi:hypothetical protein SAMN04488034_1213 [Salinimicrobium catena]|uniref:Lipoprotein n=1 Tax=Salinimicrobium catena TaxID=390640 RepID=A0A1H5PIB9_9FLAO|nr:hypothetical protein [Salinimicrobium catena]SDL87208.1 hypothetical protein SAMN04488140_1216 [Salinimicrobium catena]SEF13540.1 hypothetical protein SAMN04488034_1213 [Salinimicrobium catena]